MKKLFILTVLSCLIALHVRAAEEPVAANGSEMPLELYQKLKAEFDEIYGAKVGLLQGAPQRERAEIEAELRTAAAANKGVLLKALNSSLVIHRELAARALEYCGDKSAAIEALGKALVADPDESVRRAAAAALTKLPDAAAEDALIKALGDSVETVRALSARALGNIKDTHASEALLRVLYADNAWMVRIQAAMALKNIKDPGNLEPLKKAFDSEKDENVKIAIAGALRDLMGGGDAKLDQVPTGEEAAGDLGKLAHEMKELEEKLRNDRHDQAVQLQGGNIDKQLATLIEKLEKSSGGSGKPGEGDKSQQQQPQKSDGQNKNNPTSGMQDSKGGANVPHGPTGAAQVSGSMDSWAKLPAAQRDELLQAFREDVPERWRKRLEAYFLSVNAEENKEAEK